MDNDVRERDPNGLFNPTTIDPDGFELVEATFRPDNYDASEDINAGYAMIDAEVTETLKVMAGARLESATQIVSPFDLHDVGQAPLEGALPENTDLLPAVSLTMELRANMNLRLVTSRTLARPQLREPAPFSFADYAGGYLTVENPELVRSVIQNYDARWEFFFAPGALIAGSAFYKTFDDPIEVAVLPSTELLKSWINGSSANNYGLEIEFRSSLGQLSPGLEAVSLNSNLTLVQSAVTTPDVIRIYIPGEGGTDQAAEPRTRALQGQSPYVVLDPDSIYILSGIVTVDAGGELRVPAGTTIMGNAVVQSRVHAHRVRRLRGVVRQRDQCTDADGVGAGTDIHHVQTNVGLDDGIEFFGGTVDLKYAIVTNASDDSFDYSTGWQGCGQFWIVQQDPADADNGFEVDGNEDDYKATPLTEPTIFNVTLVGGGEGASDGADGLRDRRPSPLTLRGRTFSCGTDGPFPAPPRVWNWSGPWTSSR